MDGIEGILHRKSCRYEAVMRFNFTCVFRRISRFFYFTFCTIERTNFAGINGKKDFARRRGCMWQRDRQGLFSTATDGYARRGRRRPAKQSEAKETKRNEEKFMLRILAQLSCRIASSICFASLCDYFPHTPAKCREKGNSRRRSQTFLALCIRESERGSDALAP